MITSGYQNLVKFTHRFTKEGENNKRYEKYIFWKNFKNSIKLWMSPFHLKLQTFFTRSTLRGHSKGVLRSLQGYLWTLKVFDTWVLEHLRRSGARALRGLGHSGTWVLKDHSGTRALETLADSELLQILFKHQRGITPLWSRYDGALIGFHKYVTGVCFRQVCNKKTNVLFIIIQLTKFYNIRWHKKINITTNYITGLPFHA